LKETKKQPYWKTFIHGGFLGATLLAPGLSVATIALVLGIYEKLLGSISDFFSSKWKSTLTFLVPLGIGAVIALVASSRILTWAVDYYPSQLAFLFLGFIIGAIPLLLRTSEAKSKFKVKHIIPLVIVAILVACIRFLNPMEEAYTIVQLDTATVIRLLIAGALAAIAMLLPGLSAALMLLLMGAHATLTAAISDFNLPVIGVTMIGALVGLIVSSKGIKYLLENYSTFTYAISIGMVMGSVVVVFPGIPVGSFTILTSVVAFAVGLGGVILIDKLGSKSN
jgi:putative membrane protein